MEIGDQGCIPAKRCVPTPPPSGITEPVLELVDHPSYKIILVKTVLGQIVRIGAE